VVTGEITRVVVEEGKGIGRGPQAGLRVGRCMARLGYATAIFTVCILGLVVRLRTGD
jgi:hypothetical protein